MRSQGRSEDLPCAGIALRRTGAAESSRGAISAFQLMKSDIMVRRAGAHAWWGIGIGLAVAAPASANPVTGQVKTSHDGPGENQPP